MGGIEVTKVLNVKVTNPPVYTFDYTGKEQVFKVPFEATYRVELWGAQGGVRLEEVYAPGAYVSGNVILEKDQELYLYVGQKGIPYATVNSVLETFNGGGGGGIGRYQNGVNGSSGGGATDIRLIGGNWNLPESLNSRIIVAGGGGGKDSYNGNLGTLNAILGYGGGLVGGDGSWGRFSTSYSANLQGYGGTQVSGGKNNNGTIISSFGKGAQGVLPPSGNQIPGGGGGGGYYGGGGGMHGNHASSGGGGGGSSYISGHTGCVAIASSNDQTPKAECVTGTINNSCSLHYSGYKFTNTKMIDGIGYNWTNIKENQTQMLKPDGTYYPLGQGHTGHGYIKITLVKLEDITFLLTTNEVTIDMYSKFNALDYVKEAYDLVDGDLKNKLTITTDLNLSIHGKYIVSYKLKNSRGVVEELSLVVNVQGETFTYNYTGS